MIYATQPSTATANDRRNPPDSSASARTEPAQRVGVSWFGAFVSGLVSCCDIAGVHRASIRSSQRLVGRYIDAHGERAGQMLAQRTRRLAVGQFAACAALVICLIGGTALVLAGHDVLGVCIMLAGPGSSVLAAVTGAGRRAGTS